MPYNHTPTDDLIKRIITEADTLRVKSSKELHALRAKVRKLEQEYEEACLVANTLKASERPRKRRVRASKGSTSTNP